MGNQQKQRGIDGQEVYLTELQEWRQQELMFQSKPSASSSPEAKVLKKVFCFTSASDNIISYIQMLKFFGQYIECDNLMLPIYCFVRQTKAMCSEEQELEVYNEIYSINIKDEIMARKRHHERFTQCEVWYLLYSIVNACRKFEPYKMSSGNLKTNHVMLNPQGHLKIQNLLTEPDFGASELPNYFSPQQLKNMQQNCSTKLHPNICQTFSIAIIILQICTFMDGESFYDMFRMKLNEYNIICAEKMMQKFKYSRLLVNLVRVMLSNLKDRPLPSQIYLSFKPYEQQILNLQPFRFDPNKIYESLQNSKVSIYSHY